MSKSYEELKQELQDGIMRLDRDEIKEQLALAEGQRIERERIMGIVEAMPIHLVETGMTAEGYKKDLRHAIDKVYLVEAIQKTEEGNNG